MTLTVNAYSSIFEHMKAMGQKTTLVRARVPSKRLRNAEEILGKLGLKPGDAINMLMAQVELHQGLPFDMTLSQGSLLTADAQGGEWTEAFGEY
jgi:addiction module RelB/DinJ family antitoxin